MKSSADALLELINDILDFSKIEARRLDLERAEFDLRETVGDAVEAARAARRQKRASSSPVTSLPDVPETLLRRSRPPPPGAAQVLGNAVKFTAEGEVVLDVAVEATAPETRDAALRRQRHRASASLSRNSSRSSRRSRRPTARRRADTAAPAWASRSRCGWSS